ncbi:PfkB family carbohydrate kinase [Chthonobacter rhizosphaerae]|uniref:PfkB family carbohydrate kinase n=1 Tax=Chthonobacter rhizosphaerae TaxID=2735553 RepID=UPI0015EF6FFF|nr:PfkB family carbohydrate kinase [Chthonobacter rhizosphaerae]
MSRIAILAIGGCHRDLVGRTAGRFEPGTSCPGRVAERPGGVARNVAALLAAAGPPLAVQLATLLGADPAGDWLAAHLAAAGIGTDHLMRDPAVATGTYVALHDQDGELVAALSDLSVYDRLTPDRLAPLAPALAEASLVFADANLPAETLAALAAAAGPRLAVDAVSRAKAPRVLAPARAGALLFVNRPSAEALAGAPCPTAAEAAAALRSMGVARAVVTAGPQPLALLLDGEIHAVAVPPTPVVDVTGAGDALIAGTLLSLAHGRGLADAVGVGVEAAGAALAATGALSALPASVLRRARDVAMKAPDR